MCAMIRRRYPSGKEKVTKNIISETAITIEQREYDEKISLFEEALDFYHNDLPTLTLPYLPARLMMKLEMRTNTSITRLIMEPTP